VRRSRDFGLLFFASAGSAFGTYVAAIALVVHIKEETGSGLWVAALLIAEFAPIVLIGLLFGPLVDRLSRRWLMVVSDAVRVGLFVALIFVQDPAAIVVVAALVGVATGFFRPAVYAGLPNLVDDEELTNANSLLQTVETLAWMIGPVVAGLMLTVWSPSIPYAVNAVTFVVSAYLIYLIPESRLRSQESLTAGHWRDVADGLRLVATGAPLRTVLVVWSAVLVGSAAVNVAEVFFAQDVLLAGDVGFGVIVGASGVGLAIGSYLAAPAIGRVGLRRHYVGSIALMGVGWGAAAFSTSIYMAIPFVVAATIGNGAAIVANQLFVQRGATDRYRGRALATIMSANYAVLGVAMALAGFATDAYGARAVWAGSAVIFLAAALVAVAMTRWLRGAREEHLLEAHAVAAEEAISRSGTARVPRSVPLAEDQPATGLERIAVLLEEIEQRRAAEARRAARGSTAKPSLGGAPGSVEARAEP
jgi:MFS family permease